MLRGSCDVTLRVASLLVRLSFLVAHALAIHQVAHADSGVEVYVTDAPNDPAWLGLAAPDGRYAIQLAPGCGIQAGENATWDNGTVNGMLTDHPAPGMMAKPSESCTIVAIQKMGETPCSTNPEGVCDVAYA